MPRKKLYLYNANNENWGLDNQDGFSTLPGAVLTIPIDSFIRTKGCAAPDLKTQTLLSPENIGKQFKIWILDPVRIERVEYCGQVSRTNNECKLPQSIYRRMCEEKFFGSSFNSSVFHAFKIGTDYVVVNRSFIKARLVK